MNTEYQLLNVQYLSLLIFWVGNHHEYMTLKSSRPFKTPKHGELKSRSATIILNKYD